MCPLPNSFQKGLVFSSNPARLQEDLPPFSALRTDNTLTPLPNVYATAAAITAMISAGTSFVTLTAVSSFFFFLKNNAMFITLSLFLTRL